MKTGFTVQRVSSESECPLKMGLLYGWCPLIRVSLNMGFTVYRMSSHSSVP